MANGLKIENQTKLLGEAELALVGAFTMQFQHRGWFGDEFEPAAQPYMARLLLGTYLFYEIGSVPTKQQAMEFMGPIDARTSQRYIKLAQERGLLSVFQSDMDKRVYVLRPTDNLLKLVSAELTRVGAELRWLARAVSELGSKKAAPRQGSRSEELSMLEPPNGIGSWNRIQPVIICPPGRIRPIHLVDFHPDRLDSGVGTALGKMLQDLSDSTFFSPPILVTSKDARFVVADHVRRSGLQSSIMVEPLRRGPASSVAICAADALFDVPMLIIAYAHVIIEVERFKDVCKRAAEAAQQGYIVSFGVEPRPERGYAHTFVRPGRELLENVFEIAEWFDKPRPEDIQRLIEQKALWHTGIFMARPSVLRRELDVHTPELMESARQAKALIQYNERPFKLVPREPLARIPNISLWDVLQKTASQALVQAEIGWTGARAKGLDHLS